jgi:hypothetical protein
LAVRRKYKFKDHWQNYENFNKETLFESYGKCGGTILNQGIPLRVITATLKD